MKGWKTLGFGVLVAVVGVLQQADIASIIPMQYVGAVTSAIGVIVIALRAVTTTPVGKSA